MPGALFERGEHVTLRTVERDDAAFIQRAHNDPEVRVPLGLHHPENEHQVEEAIEKYMEGDEGINLVACIEGDDPEVNDPTPIGMVVAMEIHDDRPELSYWLLPEYQGEGYATEAVSLLVDHVFDTYDKHGLYAQAFAYNEGSWGLLERLGFEREGRFRGHRFVRGEYRDTVHYGLLREEWE